MVVSGSSMEPTLKPGAILLVTKVVPARFIKRNCIGIFDLSKVDTIPDPKPKLVVKRISALCGDRASVSIKRPLEPSDYSLPFSNQALTREIVIPPRHIFLSADGHGSDSTVWGPIPLKAFIGIVVLPKTANSPHSIQIH